jgi:hypothetical protein
MYSRISGALSYFFPSSTQPQPQPVLAFDEEAYQVDPIELNQKLGITDDALAIYKGLKANDYQCHVRKDLKSLAGIAQDPRLTRHSKHPGHIVVNGKQLNFQDANYFVDVSRTGEVRYQIQLKGNYYPIAIHDIPDPTIKNIHDRVVGPYLANNPGNENRVGNRK